MYSKIWLSSPHMGGNEINYINQALEQNWIAPLGPNVNGLEYDLQEYTGVNYAAALSSGTAAIHLALILLGVKCGDEVICQTFTFSASANPIVYCGAVPVFVDSELDTWNMDPHYLEEAIIDRLAKGKRVKAIISVCLYGMPAKMDEILKVANKYNIAVIEDAAEALGSRYKNKSAGSFGKFGILSFNGNKIITTSGGGALLSNDHATIIKARFLATQARDNAPHYEHSQIGYNYRMSNISAGIGRGQMEVLEERISQRRANHAYYQSSLQGIQSIEFLQELEGFFSNRWLTCILINPKNGIDKEKIRLALGAVNVESRPLWKPMHLQPVFKGTAYYGSNHAERLFNKGLCLPSGSNLSKDDLDRVITTIKEVYEYVNEVY